MGGFECAGFSKFRQTDAFICPVAMMLAILIKSMFPFIICKQ